VPVVPRLAKRLDDLGAKARQIVGLARGHKTIVDHHFFVRTGPRRCEDRSEAKARTSSSGLRTAPASINSQGAWQIAATTFRSWKKAPDELHRLGLEAKGVGVGDAAGQHQAIEGFDVDRVQCRVNRYPVALVEVFKRLNLPGLRGDYRNLGPSRPERLHRLGELDLFDPVGRQNGNLPPFQILRPFTPSAIQEGGNRRGRSWSRPRRGLRRISRRRRPPKSCKAQSAID
jgi:hypothetical protein